MASATARLYASRRGVRRKQERSDTTAGALSALSQVLTFAGGQMAKADTAWGEYETGYKELGGKGFEKPKFGQKGYFKGPKGDVRIGDTMYDRAKIQKAGSFLGSDASAILSDEQRQQYLGRTVQGKEVPHLGRVSGTVSGQDEQAAITQFRKGGGGFFPDETTFSRDKAPVVDQKKKIMGEGTYRGPGGQMVDPNPYADLETQYGSSLYGPDKGNIPDSIGYGQSEYREAHKAKYPQGPSLLSKIGSGIKEWGATGAGALV